MGSKADRELAWAILDDLSDRGGIPEWLGDRDDPAARNVSSAVAEIISRHRMTERNRRDAKRSK